MKKFELTTESIADYRLNLFRIKALISFGDVKAGDLGGYVEKEENLSQYGNAWVSENAMVFGNAFVCRDAIVSGYAIVCGNAWVSENAHVYGNARVYENAHVYGNTSVLGDACVYGNARVYGNANVSGYSNVCGNAYVYENAHVSCDANVFGDAKLLGDAHVCNDADYICFKGFGSLNRNTTMFKTKDGNICVSCGCFHGTLQEFEDKVKGRHGDSKFAREYLACVEAAKIHFEV